jgi:hypothetical protein
MIFKSGDKIFLSVKNIRVRKFCKKLTNRYLDSFKISEKINNNAYKLELLNQYRKLNDFFYISFLKSYVRRAGEKLSDSILINKNNRFLIDRLLNERISKGKIEYLIKWIEYPDYNNIWEPLQNLDNCEIAIYDFRMRRASERSAKRVKKIRKRQRKRS